MYRIIIAAASYSAHAGVLHDALYLNYVCGLLG